MGLSGRQILAGVGLVGALAGIGVLAVINRKRSDRERAEMDGLGLDAKGRRAYAKHEEVNWGRKPGRMIVVREGRRKRDQKYLVEIGNLEAVVYRSPKSGNEEKYLHFFDSPNPVLATDSKGKRLFIVGGKAQVDERGIVG